MIIAVDIGTSSIRAILYDDVCRIVHHCTQKVILEKSGTGEELRAEIDPEMLLRQFQEVVGEVLARAPPESEVAMGICCQRSTFVSWDKKTLKACHKLVTWMDRRAQQASDEWNRSWTVKALNWSGALLYFLTGQTRFRIARMFRCHPGFVSHRFLVNLEKDKKMQKLLEKNELGFGCIETWLLLRLTNGNVFAAERSNASSTGMYDSFTHDWTHPILWMIKFPMSVLPSLIHSASVEPIATIDESFFGRSIGIHAVVRSLEFFSFLQLADQQAATYGAGCWRTGDVNLSLGTGAFLDVNNGVECHPTMTGLYPLVGWTLPTGATMLVEGAAREAAPLMHWAVAVGLVEDLSKTSELAEKAERAPKLYFISTCEDLPCSENGRTLSSAFRGLQYDTTKAQMLAAVILSIAFRVYEVFVKVEDEISVQLSNEIRVCGGVSANDFLVQSIATLIGRPIRRLKDEAFTAARGVALLAGRTLGMWEEEEMRKFDCTQKIFYPVEEQRKAMLQDFESWTKAMSLAM